MSDDKPKRKKKDLDINIDTKNIDINLTRKDGKTEFIYDSPNLDITIEKDETSKKIDIKSEQNWVTKLLNFIKKHK